MAEARDIVIILAGSAIILLFIATIFFLFYLRSFLRSIRKDIEPILKAGQSVLSNASNVFSFLGQILGGLLVQSLVGRKRSFNLLRILSSLMLKRRSKR